MKSLNFAGLVKREKLCR